MLDHSADRTGALWTANVAVTALVVLIVVDFFKCMFAIAELEDRLRAPGHDDYGLDVGGPFAVLFTVSLLVAVVAVLVWAMWLGWTPRPSRAVVIGTGVTVVLKVVAAVLAPGPTWEDALAARPEIHLLWTAATAALTVTSALAIRSIRAYP